MGDVLGGFGKVLMDRVRDNTTASVDQMLDGTMKGITAQKIQEKIKVFDKEQMETVEWLVVQVVDLCLHNMLWMVEQEEEITLLYQGAGLQEESDGLSGELYTEDGWIQKYSSGRYEEI